MDKEYKNPFYVKASLSAIGLLATIAMLYFARSIIVPIVLATIIAILLNPVVAFFERLRISRVISISITMLITIVMIFTVGSFLVSQMIRLSDSWPQMSEKVAGYLGEIVTWSSGYFDVSPQKILASIAKTKGELISSSGSAIGQTMANLGNALIVLLLIPVYIFMILYYKSLLLEFFRSLFGSDNRGEASTIISQIKTVIQRYLSGLVIEAAIVAGLNISALLILGIEYALLLGFLGALLNVIPYLGGLVAVALPMMVAFATKNSPWYPFYVLAAYYFIQLVDNNYIVPMIVASKVKLNALISIIVVLAFGALWGIPGMFISIPLTAIAKLIFDRIESLKPWGLLLGDTMPENIIFNIKSIKRKSR
jgi:predicted PurR-regulated permease PerM